MVKKKQKPECSFLQSLKYECLQKNKILYFFMIWLLREKQTKNKNLEKTKETIFDKSWKSEMQNKKKTRENQKCQKYKKHQYSRSLAKVKTCKNQKKTREKQKYQKYPKHQYSKSLAKVKKMQKSKKTIIIFLIQEDPPFPIRYLIEKTKRFSEHILLRAIFSANSDPLSSLSFIILILYHPHPSSSSSFIILILNRPYLLSSSNSSSSSCSSSSLSSSLSSISNKMCGIFWRGRVPNNAPPTRQNFEAGTFPKKLSPKCQKIPENCPNRRKNDFLQNGVNINPFCKMFQ